jgi:hypothetical protein
MVTGVRRQPTLCDIETGESFTLVMCQERIGMPIMMLVAATLMGSWIEVHREFWNKQDLKFVGIISLSALLSIAMRISYKGHYPQIVIFA